MLLLKQDTTKKERMDKRVIELEAGNSEEYKVEAIWDSVVYINKAKNNLPDLHYLVA